MMAHQQSLFILRGLRHRFFKQAGHQFPEAVLGMAVVKILFPGFYRGEASKYQYAGCLIVNGTQRVAYPGVACRKLIFNVILLAQLFPEPAHGGSDSSVFSNGYGKGVDLQLVFFIKVHALVQFFIILKETELQLYRIGLFPVRAHQAALPFHIVVNRSLDGREPPGVPDEVQVK